MFNPGCYLFEGMGKQIIGLLRCLLILAFDLIFAPWVVTALPGRAYWDEPLPSGLNCFLCFYGLFLFLFGV